ncbi:hypothetical protein DM02DRAFT_56949 [Periconia macrospinosa]|uniref:Uncharacterized protein n=1 Tax=Periconia macrospinosa TaxID=97972 RepID=A0A2V1E7G5_9PLEO|nr:hypothetical protein DM02DRAFT_56949 [Periconia macrospinosa]
MFGSPRAISPRCRVAAAERPIRPTRFDSTPAAVKTSICRKSVPHPPPSLWLGIDQRIPSRSVVHCIADGKYSTVLAMYSTRSTPSPSRACQYNIAWKMPRRYHTTALSKECTLQEIRYVSTITMAPSLYLYRTPHRIVCGSRRNRRAAEGRRAGDQVGALAEAGDQKQRAEQRPEGRGESYHGQESNPALPCPAFVCTPLPSPAGLVG